MTPKQLLELLAMPFALAARASTVSSLQHLHICEQVVTATDLSTHVQVDLNNADGVLADVAGCVDAKRFGLALGTLAPNKELSVAQRDGRLVLKCAGATRSMPVAALDIFPMPTFGQPTQHCQDPKTLAEAVLFAQHAAAPNNFRPALFGLTSMKGHIFASDGHRAARQLGAAEAASIGDGVILPIGALEDLAKLAQHAAQSGEQLLCNTVRLADQSARAYAVACDRWLLQFQLVDAAPMPFDRVIPSQHAEHHINVGREALAGACRGLQRIAGRVPHARMEVCAGDLHIELASRTQTGEEADARVAVDARGMDGWSAGINAAYLADALEALRGDIVTLSQSGTGQAEPPIFLTGSEPSQACVVTPVKL